VCVDKLAKLDETCFSIDAHLVQYVLYNGIVCSTTNVINVTNPWWWINVNGVVGLTLVVKEESYRGKVISGF